MLVLFPMREWYYFYPHFYVYLWAFFIDNWGIFHGKQATSRKLAASFSKGNWFCYNFIITLEKGKQAHHDSLWSQCQLNIFSTWIKMNIILCLYIFIRNHNLLILRCLYNPGPWFHKWRKPDWQNPLESPGFFLDLLSIISF